MKGWTNSDTPQNGIQIPEKRLLAAVLQRAITDFFGGDGELRDGARHWLLEGGEPDAPLTFEFICEALDIDIDNLKRAIRQHAENPERFFTQEAVM